MILVAPDKFKGSFSSREVADAVVRGIEDAGGEGVAISVADGGEGTAAALARGLGGHRRTAPVHDPLGREIEAEWFLLSGGETAVIDVAAASGLSLIAESERDPWRASTAGTGELILEAVAAGAQSVIVGAGGSATVDGGAGAIEVLREAERAPRLVVACDVRTPWEQAAEVYGPQKGADPETVARLAGRLDELATETPRDPRGIEMSGASGGLAGGLWAFLGAELVAGADYVLDAIQFDDALGDVSSVITGEGRLDAQTLEGKAVATIAARAGARDVPCDAVVAIDALGEAGRERLGLRRVVEARTLAELSEAGAALAGR